jgi:3-oxoacyl-[acyl-carrier protein] reductase
VLVGVSGISSPSVTHGTPDGRPAVVVWGGGTGVGRAATRALAAGGAEVLIVGPSGDVLEATAREIEAEIVGSSIAWWEADLADPEAATGLVDHVHDTYGVLDAVVACAHGGPEEVGPALSQVAAAWRGTFVRDVLGSALLAYGLAPLLRRPGGRIVLVRPPVGGPGAAPVDAVRSAFAGWVTSLAAEFGPAGITANVVSPTHPPDDEPFGAEAAAGEPERIARALGRTARSDDVAGVIAFLVSPEAASVTGQVIGVAGTAAPPSG